MIPRARAHVGTLIASAREAVITVGQKYVELCKWIRQKQIAPKMVTNLLIGLGFAKSRVSEINRIAQCADELWKEYEAGLIGRNRILELARHANEKDDLLGIDADERQEGDGPKEGGPEFVESPEDVKQRKIATMQKSAKAILTIAEFLNLRSRTFDDGNGWVLELKKSKKTAKTEKKEKTDETPMPERDAA